MVVVTNRTQATLENEIANYILPGSHIISEHIISDGWAVYVHIDQMQGAVYTHETVIHDVNFVNPDNQDIHTQNIENMWMRVKRKLRRQFGTSRALFKTYLSEFGWRNFHRNDDKFNALMCCIDR
jgi:hypothetical protein